MQRIITACLLLVLLPAGVLAEPKVFLVGGLIGQVPAAGAIHARLGQPIRLYVVVQAGRGRRATYYSDAPQLRLGRRLLRPSSVKPLHQLGKLRFSWSLVEPHPHHINTLPPNPGNPAYSNAILFGPRHGTWLGYDTIEYYETNIPQANHSTLIVTQSTPTHPRVNVNGGLGTMRYKATVWIDGQSYAAPGMDAAGPHGIFPTVMRVSFREADDFVGYLTALFNVPNVFGSGGHHRTHQTELYQGADCADVIIGAVRSAGVLLPYTSALGLRHYAHVRTPILFLDDSGIYHYARGQKGPKVELAFPQQIQRGDIMLINYANLVDSPRSWDHVAVVKEDQGAKGVFDPHDLILHMGYLYGLTQSTAASEGPAIIQFLRFKPSIVQRLKKQQNR